MKASAKRRLIWAALGLIAIILIAIPKKEETVEVSCSIAALSSIAETVPANGKIYPATEVTLSPDVSGEIVEIYCREGDKVKKGQLLVKIRQDIYILMAERAEASLNSAKAHYSQQRARYMQSQRKYIRDSILFAGGAISETELESSMSEMEIAKEQLNGAEFAINSEIASFNEAKENLRKTMIYAPMTGIISMIRVKVGERVVGTSQMEGTEMLRIADFSQMELCADVNENDIIKLSEYDSATISIDPYQGQKFYGRVKEIASSAKNINSIVGQVTNFEVKINIDQESYANLLSKEKTPLRPGMSASASIQTNKKSGITIIPLKSVTMKDGTESAWVVDKDNTVSLRHIVTGIQDLENIEVKSGLDIGETVVTSPYSAINRTLESGKKVKIREPQ